MKRAVVVIALAVALLTVSGCGRAPVAEVGVTRIASSDREAMPLIAGTTVDGQPLSLADDRGRVIVLNNWASWCAPCREEIPVLVQAAQEHGDAVAFVGLNVSDEPKAARDFAAQTGMSYPSIVDADGALLASIPGVPAKALPSTVVVDSQGRIAARVIGKVDATELNSILDDLKAEAA